MSKGLCYVAIDPGIAEDPAILDIAERYDLDPFALAGRCVRFFGKVAEHRPDGDLTGLAGATLDAWAGGGVAGLGLSIRDALVDEAGRLRAWDRYNGSALRRLESDRERQRNRRLAALANKSTDRPRTVHGSSTDNPRIVHGESVTTGTIPNNRSSSATHARAREDLILDPPVESVAERQALLCSQLPPSCHPALHRLLTNARAGALGVCDQLDALLALRPGVIATGPGMKPLHPDHVAELIVRMSSTTNATWHKGTALGMIDSILRGAKPPASRNGHRPRTSATVPDRPPTRIPEL